MFFSNRTDEPPPAYEITPSTNVNPTGSTDHASATTVIEAPPPYCLVDPSKVRNTDHLPHYPHISPVEVIDLNAAGHHNNDQVSNDFLVRIDLSKSFVFIVD